MTPRDGRRAWRLAVSAVVWAMYGVSLALPAVAKVGMGDQVVMGYDALLQGWLGLGIVTELANVALLFGWIGYMVRQNALAGTAGVVGIGLSMTAPVVFGIPRADLLVGFYLWVGTMAAFSLAAGWEFLYEIRELQKETPPQG